MPRCSLTLSPKRVSTPRVGAVADALSTAGVSGTTGRCTTRLPGFTVLYSPGYTPFKAIGKVQARELADKRDGTLWVHLTPLHSPEAQHLAWASVDGVCVCV